MVEKLARISKITDETLIPIGLVLVVIGAAMWLTNVDARGRELETAMQERAKRDEEYYKTVQEISTRLARIEGAVGVKGFRDTTEKSR